MSYCNMQNITCFHQSLRYINIIKPTHEHNCGLEPATSESGDTEDGRSQTVAANKASVQTDMPVNSSSNSSHYPPLDDCTFSKTVIFLSTAFYISNILLLPLFIIVLCVGFQRWRKQRSVAAAATTSHSDIFTFNIVSLELLSILGSSIYFYGVFAGEPTVMVVGYDIWSIMPPGQTLLHLLTCVERYLAVVHPVTYMGLKRSGGVRIRNISIVCAWLFSCGALSLSRVSFYFNIVYSFAFLFFSIVVVSFCSLSVLCVLVRPGPGEVGGNRKQVDRSKQRAVHTILAVAGVLLLRFFSSLISTAAYFVPSLKIDEKCLVGVSSLWFSLPSSLLLPLLFLHRVGKLPCCKHKAGSG